MTKDGRSMLAVMAGIALLIVAAFALGLVSAGLESLFLVVAVMMFLLLVFAGATAAILTPHLRVAAVVCIAAFAANVAGVGMSSAGSNGEDGDIGIWWDIAIFAVLGAVMLAFAMTAYIGVRAARATTRHRASPS